MGMKDKVSQESKIQDILWDHEERIRLLENKQPEGKLEMPLSEWLKNGTNTWLEKEEV